MKHIIAPLLIAVTLLYSPVSSRAWNKPGHMLTASIAYRELAARDIEALSTVVALLKQHPYYRQAWKQAMREQRVSPQGEGLFLFMYAARWPDDARGTSFHHGDWHFINFPFSPGGQQFTGELPAPRSPNIVEAFEENMRALRGGGSDADKAVALAWVFHLTGDVHQPLHTIALFSTLFPEGDRGGNAFFVQTGPSKEKKNLHALWDEMVINTPDKSSFAPVSAKTRELLSRPSLSRPALRELPERRFEAWARRESFEAAVKHAYLNGVLRGTLEDGPGTPLPRSYLWVNTPLAERRVVLAGYRLADLLSEMF